MLRFLNLTATNINNFKLSLLGFVHFLGASWNIVSPTVITNGWFHKNGDPKKKKKKKKGVSTEIALVMVNGRWYTKI
jgi:hypothetical protein